jgi:hypothetical protein
MSESRFIAPGSETSDDVLRLVAEADAAGLVPILSLPVLLMLREELGTDATVRGWLAGVATALDRPLITMGVAVDGSGVAFALVGPDRPGWTPERAAGFLGGPGLKEDLADLARQAGADPACAYLTGADGRRVRTPAGPRPLA